MRKQCYECGAIKELTDHSPWGGHKPPYVILCRDCHDEVHGTKNGRKENRSQKGNLKNAKGTRRRKSK